MFKQRNRRGGFTLPEVLVTVAIVAVLAAMVVPAVTQQISKGDAPSFLGSVTSLRTAIASFAADVRKLPGEVSQLSVDIDDADPPTEEDLAATADGGVAYTEAIAARWRGPYESSGTTTGIIPIGYGWSTADDLVDLNGYIVVSLTKTDAVIADAVELDNAVDGGNGATAGLIRWDATATPALTPANTISMYLMSSAK